ncbi:hypothetical protein ACJBU6_02631 [Exserohilum turcicum]
MKFEFGVAGFAVVVSTVRGAEQWPLSGNIKHQSTVLQHSLIDSCEDACQTLRKQYPSQVSFSNEETYSAELSQFWSLQQSQTLPACFFRPKTSQDVASAILISHKTACRFAVKSGGHVPFAGASNVAGGITIDLAELNEVTVNSDRNTATVGPGNNWGSVYRQLEKEQKTVVGGRIATVGVGGLTLGGGISFFSNIYGLACDNIATYEVVTATGDIITASATSNPDLFWALRGGASNFGVVTSFEMQTYPQEQNLMWIGKVLHPWTERASVIKAFADFGTKDTDANATLLFSFVYLQKQDQYISVSEMDYATSVAQDAHPPVFDAFFQVPNSMQASKETKTIVDVIEAHSASNPNGLRQSYWTATFILSQSLAEEIVEMWKEEIDPIKSHVTGFIPVLTLQVITVRMMEHMEKNGGNALGLAGNNEPLMIAAPSAMWTDSAHDETVLSAYSKWLSRSNARARKLGLDHRYLYMNYASQFQDPIRGYGELNVERLKRVAEMYDPEGTFQKLQPGHFKL